jgi:hypothetical protein
VRRLVPAFLLVVFLALPAVSAANQTVAISTSGFSDTAPEVKPGENVTFTNSSPAFASVRFDDDSAARCQTGAEANCVRTFPTAGHFPFYDPQQGCTSYASCTGTHRGVVIVDGPPTVTSLSGPVAENRGQAVAFTASASDPNGAAITGFNWDFGDGTSATTADGAASHVYTAAGHFTITLTVTDARANTSAPAQTAVDIQVPDSDGDGVNDDLDKCPGVAGPPPDGCPLIPSPFVPKIKASAAAAGALGQSGALKSGINVVLSCSAACNGIFTLSQNGRPVGATATALASSGSKLVTVQFTSAARRALARAKSPRLLLQVNVADVLGRTQTRKSWIVLEPVKTQGKLPAIGISDNQPATFADPFFQILRLHYARLVTPWNSVFSERARLDAWLQAARSQGIRPLVSFEHARGARCPKQPCKGPNTAQYKRAWTAFHKKYPWVRDISPWNEVNSATQPTGGRPDLAATYYNVVRASCRGCSIVAADLLDTTNIRRYVAAFLTKAQGKPRLWGLHNYTDTNRFRANGTTALLQSVKGTVWLTETGGVVKFVTQGGKVALPKSETRAKKAMDYMFRLAETNAARIKRIYVYQWKINNLFDRFDAGVVRPDGTPRPSFDVLTLNASIARKR